MGEGVLKPTGERLVWHRRLSVRLALLVAIAMIAFAQLSPFVTRTVAESLGLEVHKPFIIAYDSDNALDLEAVCSLPEDVISSVRLLGGSDAEEARTSLAEALDRWTCSPPHGYVVTGPDLVVIDSDGTARHAAGDQFSADPFQAGVVGFYPVTTESEGLRWLCLLPNPEVYDGHWPEGSGANFPADTVVLSEAEAERQISDFQLIGIVVSWVLPLAAALVLGLMVSMGVTRRIVRLNRAVSDHSIDSIERFTVSGRDEIAGLGAALADARRHVAALIRKIAEKDAQRREWFAQVSHDLRTPLTALSACLERAAPLVEGIPESEARRRLAETLGVARQDTERVHTLASDLLEAARLELPDALITEDLLPEEVVERAVTGMSPLAERAGKSLRFKSRGVTGSVRGDGGRLMRVLENLVRNGIEHADSEVVVSIEAIGVELEVAVLDDGPGFELDAAGGISQRNGHARADSAGLGLVVVKRVLQAHGSRLELHNRPCGGASASFRLMMLADSADPVDAADPIDACDREVSQ